MRMPRAEPDFPPCYTGWRPQGARRHPPYSDRYMFSYGNSVHMDPTASDSHAERERCEELRRQAASYGGRNPFAQDFVRGWMKRKETMEETVERAGNGEEGVVDGRFFTGESGFHQFSRPYWQQQSYAQPMEPVVEGQEDVHGQQEHTMPMDDASQQHPFAQFAEGLEHEEQEYVKQESDKPMGSPDQTSANEQVASDLDSNDQDGNEEHGNEEHGYMQQDHTAPTDPVTREFAFTQEWENRERKRQYMQQHATYMHPGAQGFAYAQEFENLGPKRQHMQQHENYLDPEAQEFAYTQGVENLRKVGGHSYMQEHAMPMGHAGNEHRVYAQPAHENENSYMNQGCGMDMNMEGDQHQSYAESVEDSEDNDEPVPTQQQGVWAATEHGHVYAWAQSVADAGMHGDTQDDQQHDYVEEGIEEQDLLDFSASVDGDDLQPGIVQSVEDESDEQRSESTEGPEDEEDLLDLSETEYGTANQSEGLYSDSLSGHHRYAYMRATHVGTDQEDGTDVTSFYDVRSTQSTTADAEHSIPRLILTELVTRPELNAFIPYFEEKLNHPSGCYTTDDLEVELKGIYYETYCGWLENVRLAVPGAQALTTGNNPDNCSHLGFWIKELHSPECDVCHRWRPLYMLTCPGCGIRKCVGCKFANWMDVGRGVA